MQRKSVYIETYGCQMNKLDSETVAAVFAGAGYTVTHDYRDADVVLFNTCGVRENAERRIHGRVAELSHLRNSRPGMVFGIIGCMAQRLGEELLSDVVSVVAGPDSYRSLPDLVGQAQGGGRLNLNLDAGELYEEIPPVRESPFSAWVAVTRGCNNFCSYCIVPYTRGRERSVPAGRVIDEVHRLVDEGYQEVTLLGQNVNSYRSDGVDFARLLAMVAETGIPWVRFLTSHPKDLTTDILAVMAGFDSVCRHLHLPLQSGSNRILGAMNRRYTVERYMSLVEEAKNVVDGISLTTDIIFGFPGETEGDFRETLAVLERVEYDSAYLYRYSERPGTRACSFPDPVPEDLRIERLKEAIELQQRISRTKHDRLNGTIQTVLIKGKSKDGRGWYGFNETSVPVVVEPAGENSGAREPGDFVTVRITGTTGASLRGKIE